MRDHSPSYRCLGYQGSFPLGYVQLYKSDVGVIAHWGLAMWFDALECGFCIYWVDRGWVDVKI